jgi:hypothetical protein
VKICVPNQLETIASFSPVSELMVIPGMPRGLFIVLQTILRPGHEDLPPCPYYRHPAIDTIACGGRPENTIGRQQQRYISLYPSMPGEIAIPAVMDCPRKQLDSNQIMNPEKIWNRQPQATTPERLFNFTAIN